MESWLQRALHKRLSRDLLSPRMRGPLSLLLAASLALSGCFSRDAPAADVAKTAVFPGAVVSEDGTILAPASFGAGELVDTTLWSNGTFTIAQHGRPVGLLPGLPSEVVEPRGVVRFDVTEHVPVGLPVRLIAEVDAQVGRGDVDLWPEIPDGEWRTGRWETPFGGWSRIEIGFTHLAPGPVAVLLAYDEMDEQAEFPYTLSVRIVADPELVVHGIVTGVTLPADPTLRVELVDEPREGVTEAPRLMVFSPDDEYLGAFPLDESTSLDLPAGSPSGEYVLLLSQRSGRNARLLVGGGSATLRAMEQEPAMGDVVLGDAAGHVRWSTTYDRVPLLAGLMFRSPNVAMNVLVRLTGPEGVLFEDRVDDGPWVGARLPDGSSFDNWFGWDSLYGAPGLAAGAYEGEVTFDHAAGHEPVEAHSMAAFYLRERAR